MKGYFTKLLYQTRLPGGAAGKFRQTERQFTSTVPVTASHVIDSRPEIASGQQPFLDKSDQRWKERNMSGKVPLQKDLPARVESTATEGLEPSRLQAKPVAFSTAPESLRTQEVSAGTDLNPEDATQTGFKAGGREHDSTLGVGIGHREHAGHDAVKQVREWVAATPSGGDADDHSEFGILDHSNGRIPSSSRESNASRGDPSKPGGAHQQYLEMENQELHLSIGSISFTIEEPAGENQHRERARVGRNTTPARDRGSSRLSRHYLRIK